MHAQPYQCSTCSTITFIYYFSAQQPRKLCVKDTFNKIFPFFLKKEAPFFYLHLAHILGSTGPATTDPFYVFFTGKTDIRLPGQATLAAMPNNPQQRVHCLAVSFFLACVAWALVQYPSPSANRSNAMDTGTVYMACRACRQADPRNFGAMPCKKGIYICRAHVQENKVAGHVVRACTQVIRVTVRLLAMQIATQNA